MAAKKIINFGVIGCGLMGREFASAAARWCHLDGLPYQPKITAVCDLNEDLTKWFEDNVDSVNFATNDYHELLAREDVDAVYCAVPHNLHEKFYIDIIKAGKHLLGEKPFGIDASANEKILEEIKKKPDLLVRCSSEFPFYPGAYTLNKWIADDCFGEIIEVEAGFWHSSDLNPKKAINWKRKIEFNGEYGCMGDLGMHVCHVPFRAGWYPQNVRALLANIIKERPDGKGGTEPCLTWDNATLACEAKAKDGSTFPMTLSTKRIAPGHANTWFIRVWGTEKSVEFSTKNPKEIRWMDYKPGGEQSWHVMDTPFASAYKGITGGIFEFGFPDGMMQMWAAFCDELTNGKDGMSQFFHCATPEEAAASHRLFTAALESQKSKSTVSISEVAAKV